jgi:hypothetical protein
MTELRVSEAVCQAFPRLRIAVVAAFGFGGHEPWPEVDAELAALEKAAADGRTRRVSTQWLTPASPATKAGPIG